MSGLVSAPVFDPLRLGGKTWPLRALFVLAGTAFLALSSQISVPMVPVPITMQTFAVTMIGVIYGWRLGGVTILAWLTEAIVGLPVLANGAGGIGHFAGPTAGYLVSFPLIGGLAGWLAARGWAGDRVILSFLAHLSANVLCLVIGAAWLATLIGLEKAVMLGAVPFLLGAVMKSALAAAVVKAILHSVRKPADLL
ncbi:biotin transporter BioY [Sinorhizobium mexicanum]|uniref:Biotin transporter n=1 Tax=Sinorhizobium mexicanum TaxID=375549 RepID=A0A859QNB7_9HYPH|nr:biotin transporter BioY [Sinorhizobium mexicanum]MBP1883007.1 biotin transport system substrate-specific component [Sinorhizobium mexicanum]QLL60859.1 biotin transporter BioY [Sinorhizobium mexicanum]